MSRTGDLVRAEDYPAMWRVMLPSGELSDLLNRQRATELSRLLVLEDQQRKWAKGKGRAA